MELSEEQKKLLLLMSKQGVLKHASNGFYGTTYKALLDRGLTMKWFSGSYRLTRLGKETAKELRRVT